jgi:putative ABC transport system permease protein
MTWAKVAFRNLARNRRRSLLTICAVALGYSAVNVFGGFTVYMFDNLRDSFIHAQGNGHLQVFKKGYRAKGTTDPGTYFLTGLEFETIKRIAKEDTRIRLVAGRMHLTGFVNYGDTSTIFVGTAMVPSEQRLILESAERLEVEKQRFEGVILDDADTGSVAVAKGLAENLGIEQGTPIILMAPTLDGQMNAVDASTAVVFMNLDESLNDKLIALPLALAQQLYDTSGVGFACVLLEHGPDLAAVRASLAERLAEEGLDVEILSWDEISNLYAGTKAMFDIIFGLVFTILVVIVGMSVMNTIGMAVMERTSEIGTLRSMGLRRTGVIKLFAIESCLLGTLGSAAGVMITVAVWWAVEAAAPTWIPPMVARPVRWEIPLVPHYLLFTFFFLSLLTMAAAILPARRAARASIVDALGHI